MPPLRRHFPEITVINGSRLDAVCHRLEITHDVRSPMCREVLRSCDLPPSINRMAMSLNPTLAAVFYF